MALTRLNRSPFVAKHPVCLRLPLVAERNPSCKVHAQPDAQQGPRTVTTHQAPTADKLQGNGAASGRTYAEQQPEAQPLKEHRQQFDWYKAWYPLAVLEDLDPTLPSHAKLLGMDLAIWYDRNTANWRVFRDRCPHRLAPLSEGRIDAAGHLYCNYHGWQFDGSGSCKGIPQLPQDQPVNANKSCAVSYPTCEREGLLWVWPDGSPAAAAKSSAPEAWPGLAPELDAVGDKAHASRHKWYFRDLPASYLAVKENAYNDYSHDTVLHHGYTGVVVNRETAAPTSMQLVDMTPVGYVTQEMDAGRVTDTIRFPCGARRDYASTPSGFPGAGVAYIVPTAVGSCRQFHAGLTTDKSFADWEQQKKTDNTACSSGSSSKENLVLPAGVTAVAASGSGVIASGGTPGGDSGSANSGANPGAAHTSNGAVQLVANLANQLQRLKYALQPVWAWHMMSHFLVDADVAMQSRIDINRAASDHVYMPAAVDAGPAAFMRWLREYGGGGPPVAKLDAPFMGQPHTPPSTRQQLLDRFHSHTSQCQACRTAYQQATVARQVAAVVALPCGGAALAAAALLAAAGLPGDAVAAGRCVGTVVGLGVVAGLAGGLWGLLGRMLQHFVFVHYGHQHAGKLCDAVWCVHVSDLCNADVTLMVDI